MPVYNGNGFSYMQRSSCAIAWRHCLSWAGCLPPHSQAEKQEEQDESNETAMNLDMGADGGGGMLGQVDHKNDAVMTIDGSGIIQMVNKVAFQMLGYKKGELDGKNVSCIMPQPFAGRHNTFLRNYHTTGALTHSPWPAQGAHLTAVPRGHNPALMHMRATLQHR